uniref:transposase family protein n=1 Tax=Klebsiella pneumoniae TaxID=573 RepID=UPI001C8F9047
KQTYLVVVDFYSRWIEAIRINSKTIIDKLKDIFSRFGIPKLMIADNVPFAILEFKQFAK